MKRAAWLNGTKIDRKINASQCTICGSDGICGHLIKQTIANNNGDVFARPIAVADITQARRMIHGQDQDRISPYISPYIPSAVAGRQNQESTDHRSSPYSPGFYEQIAMRATEHAQAQIQMRAHAQTQIQAQIQDPAVSGPVSPGMVFRH